MLPARLLAVATLLAGIWAPAGTTAATTERVLVVLGTAGGQPYTTADVEQVARQAASFVERSSYGRVHLQFDVTPWLAAYTATPGCQSWSESSLDGVVAPARLAAARAGYRAEVYASVIYAVADSRCAFHGITWGHQVMLTRQPTAALVVHELGHTFGLGHAQASRCAHGCTIDDTGDPFSPMGSGLSDFSSYEKSLLGWLGPQPRAHGTGRYELVAAGRPTGGPHALVVNTADGRWWLEYRTSPARGLLVRFVDPQDAPPPFAASPRLILDPVHAGRPWVAAGETFGDGREFKVRLVLAASGRAEVQLTSLRPRHKA